ncbi:MAG TPA: glucose-1-phosphate thymidylyltransferase, partial [Thermodesulfobacteriota bacterium]|nr:glucose-1-phosphate thymidylyltransferase [Thermodesulfobacteriota bacterium]
MFKPENFFSLTDWEERTLFDNINPVWEVLPKIKSFIQSSKAASLKTFFPGEYFITRLTVLYQGELLAEGIRVVPGDAVKGKFQVFYRNQELQGATVFYGGVTLSGEDIFIGEGTVVETGAYIQGPTLIGRQTEVRQ